MGAIVAKQAAESAAAEPTTTTTDTRNETSWEDREAERNEHVPHAAKWSKAHAWSDQAAFRLVDRSPAIRRVSFRDAG